jgi:ferritin-like metal-binding protein YciE
MPDPTASEAKLIQYLNEAYGKEQELVTSLQAHITMTTRAPYKKRLQQHLKETKAHARDVERRIKKIGGKAEAVPAPGPEVVAEVASSAQGLASKAVAAAKGPLHALRGTGEQEKMLKNAQTEYQEEAREIAMYSAIETFAEAVGDKETAKLARTIKRDEERMAKFLSSQIETLVKGVVQEEVPSSERKQTRRRSSSRKRSSSSAKSRSTGSGSGRSRASSSRTAGSRSRSTSGGRKGGARSGGSRAARRSKSSSGGGSRSSSSRSGSGSRSSSSRSGAGSRSSSSRSSSSSKSRSSGSRSGGGRSRKSS